MRTQTRGARIETPRPSRWGRSFFPLLYFSLACALDASAHEVSGLIAANTTWTLADSPVQVTGAVTVSNGARLTVEPGVVVKFHPGRSLTVAAGELSAGGTPALPVIFTSIHDDAAGGDTNNNGSFTLPDRGNWGAVGINGTASSATLANFIARYGGGTNVPMLGALNGSNFAIAAGTISYSAHDGLTATQTSVLSVASVTFAANAFWALNADESSRLTVMRRNSFTGANGVRIFLPQTVQADGNTFLDHAGLAMLIHPGVTLQGFQDTVVLRTNPGGFLAAEFLQTSVNTPATWVGSALPFRLGPPVTFNAGAHLTITKGAVIKGDGVNAELILQGGLTALGTPANPITFTSIRDDTVAGDTNGDGSATLPDRGNWGRVRIDGTASSGTLKNFFMRYGGSNDWPMLWALNGATVTVAGGEIGYSANDGIQALQSSVLSVASVTFTGNQVWALNAAESSLLLAVRRSTFTGTSGVRIAWPQTVQADGNVFLDHTGLAMQIHPGITLQGFQDTVVVRTADGGILAAEFLQTSVNTPATWVGSILPFRLRVPVTFNAGAPLTITSGAVIKGDGINAELTLQGGLTALGTPEKPVIFTSIHDDATGGDTNGNGSSTLPDRGNWGRVRIDGTASSGTLNNFFMRYGGSNDWPMLWALNGATVAVSGGEIGYSANDGIQALQSSVLSVASVTFTGNRVWALNASESSLLKVMRRNSFAGVNGVRVFSPQAIQADGNTFRDHAQLAMLVHPGVTLQDFSDTAVVRLGAGGILAAEFIQTSVNTPATWVGSALPFRLRLPVTFNTGAHLTITEGAVIKGDGGNGSLTLLGGLTALGTPAAPITFTSIRDDSVVGDSNGDGSTTLPDRGNWSYLAVDGTASSGTIANARLRYGGGAFDSPMLWVKNGARLELTDVEASFSGQEAIRGENNSVITLTSAALVSNITGLSAFSGAQAEIHGCRIEGNSNFGVFNGFAGVTLQAQFNWWGSSTGPRHATANPGGLGDQISNNVAFTPFLDSPPAQQPPQAASVTLLDPSPTRSAAVRFQVRFTKAMNPSAVPFATAGLSDPYFDYTAGPGTFLSSALWESSLTFPPLAPDGTYYLRIEGAEDDQGTAMTISTHPFYRIDNTPPQISITSPAAGAVVSRPMTLRATAFDADKIASVAFLVDGSTIGAVSAEPFEFPWDTRAFADGDRSVSARASDRAGNQALASRSVTLSYSPPPAPSITAPLSGFAVNAATIVVSGLAAPGTTVQVLVNGLDLATAAVSGAGAWSVLAVLPREDNVVLTAIAFEARGFSSQSSPVTGVFTTAAPDPPGNVSASVRSGGQVLLAWAAPTNKTPAFYRVYRSTDEMNLLAGTTATAALRIGNNVTALSFTDTPSSDGLYFYGITALDGALNESLLSQTVYALNDRAPPSAAVRFTTAQPVGLGTYRPELILSEVLAVPPIFTFTPQGGQPSALNLEGVTATLWRATVTITGTTPSGTATFAFQGTDLAGNVGTSLSSRTLVLDTGGPTGTVTLSKLSPVSTGPLDVFLELDEPSAAPPVLSFTPQGGPSAGVFLLGLNQSWSGTVFITSTTGDAVANFSYAAYDFLGNVGTKLSGGTTFFIIDTTAPGAPLSVRANPAPEGKVALTWSAPFGERPSHYRIYRDEVRLPTIVVPAPDGSGSFEDFPGEGQHRHEVSSVDLAGNESALSDPVSVADATPPAAPVNLSGAVNAFGQVQLDWQAASTDTASFRLYRATFTVLDKNNLTNVLRRTAVPPFIESPAADGVYHYSVTALDQAGNESALSGEVLVTYDKAAPVITITGVTPDGFHKTNVTPAFTVFDAGLDTASVRSTLDGNPFVSGSTVSAEGFHALTVTAADLENHASTATVSFVIDKTAPAIIFAGVQAGSVVFSSVAVQISVVDLNPAASSFFLTNQTLAVTDPYNGEPITRDGQYFLEASATDKAANSSTATLSFRLDVAPVAPMNLSVRIEGSARLAWTKPEPDVIAYRVYRDGARISSSLHPDVSFEDSGFTAGAHVYEVSAVDARGSEGAKARATVADAVLSLAPITLTRGFFDAVHPQVRNNSGASVTVGPALVQLLTGAGVVATATAPAINAPAGQTAGLEGVVAVPVDISVALTVRAAVSLPTDLGATVTLAGSFSVTAKDPQAPILEVFPDALVPGTESPVQVRLYNRGSAPMDVVTAEVANSTFVAANDVQVRLLTTEGTLFGYGGLKQTSNGVSAGFVGGKQIFFATIPPGSSRLFDPVRVLVPNTVVSSLRVEAAVSTPTYNLPLAGLKGTRSYASGVTQGTIKEIAYRASAEPEFPFYDQGSSVTIFGMATNENGFAVAGATVEVHMLSNGFDRHVEAITDSSGAYRTGFFPMPNEAGIYNAFASHPDVVTHAVHSSFTIIGFGFNFREYTATLAQNSSLSFKVELQNTGATVLSELRATTVAFSGAGVSLALDQSTLPPTLPAGAKTLLNLVVSAGPAASTSTLLFAVSDSHGFIRILPITAQVFQALVIPDARPQVFEMGMLAGESRTQGIILENKGFETWRNVRLSTPTLEWVQIQGTRNLGDISPGGVANFNLRIEPPLSTPSTTYVQNPLVEVFSDNASTVPINAGIVVTSSRKGGILYNVIDADQPRSSGGQGSPVGEAIVSLTSIDIPGLTFKAGADLNGLARFQDIPSGNFAYTVEAKGFQPNSGTTTVEPGLTKTLEALLVTATITYEWSVTPTTITDKYDVSLNLTFRTDVPAPIVVVDPPVVTINVDSHVDAFGHLTVTNRGLISATDVDLTPDSPDGEVIIELAVTHIPELAPGESVVVPYRVRHGQEDGPHCHKDASVGCKYGYLCAAGILTRAVAGAVKFLVGNLCEGLSGDFSVGGLAAGAGWLLGPSSVVRPWDIVAQNKTVARKTCDCPPLKVVVIPGYAVTQVSTLAGENRGFGAMVTPESTEKCPYTVTWEHRQGLGIVAPKMGLSTTFSPGPNPGNGEIVATASGPGGSGAGEAKIIVAACGVSEYEPLRDEKKLICGLVRACGAGDSCPTLSEKKGVFQACIAARLAVNNTCFRGGDDDHQTPLTELANGIRNCENYLGAKMAAGLCR